MGFGGTTRKNGLKNSKKIKKKGGGRGQAKTDETFPCFFHDIKAFNMLKQFQSKKKNSEHATNYK